MACFLVLTAEAIIASAVKHHLQKKEEQHGKKYDIIEVVIKDIACDNVDAITPRIRRYRFPT